MLAGRDRARPTFLFASFNAPHIPNEAPEPALEPYRDIENAKRRLHAGMVAELDRAIGRIVAALAEEGMLDNTLIVFFSDNGGLVADAQPQARQRVARFFDGLFGRPVPIDGIEFLVTNTLDGASDNRPLAGARARVPKAACGWSAALWWPDRLRPHRSDRFMTVSDVLPTLLEAVGGAASVPDGFDGRSQWATLTGSGDGGVTPDYVVVALGGSLALYRAPWKLVDTDPPRLYQIMEDRLEQHDRAAEHPDIVRELKAAADAWPRGGLPQTEGWRILLDPDTFGGGEDREPWADVARRRAAGEF